MPHFDCIIAGAGVVALTTTFEILNREPSARVAVAEKEDASGRPARGRNSGVLHCGLHYGSDTRKAQVCVAANRLGMDYILEGDKRSLHVLNAISPAFAGSFAFSPDDR